MNDPRQNRLHRAAFRQPMDTGAGGWRNAASTDSNHFDQIAVRFNTKRGLPGMNGIPVAGDALGSPATPGTAESQTPLTLFETPDGREGFFLLAGPQGDANGFLYRVLAPSDDAAGRGQVHAARFRETGAGTWCALDFRDVPKTGGAALADAYGALAVAAGATPMPQALWCEMDTTTDRLYFGLAPRSGDDQSRVLRLTHEGGDYADSAFDWEVFTLRG
jgi:hypothetical protein